MKTNYEIRYAAHPEDAKSYDTKRIRRDFLIEKVFSANEVNMVYSMYDRMVVGGAMPVGEVLKLEAIDPLKAPFFLTRREMGIFNVGGPGVVKAGNAVFELDYKEALYLGSGDREVTFESKDEKNTNLRSEDNFLNYMYRLKEGENFTAIISARGDVTGGYNDGALSAVKDLGLEKLLTAQKNQRYIAIIEGGKVVREELSKDRIDTGVIDVLGYKTQIISDADESIVKMGNKNYSLNERGMNIVVLDNTTRNIVDKVRFKTYYVMLSATR